METPGQSKNAFDLLMRAASQSPGNNKANKTSKRKPSKHTQASTPKKRPSPSPGHPGRHSPQQPVPSSQPPSQLSEGAAQISELQHQQSGLTQQPGGVAHACIATHDAVDGGHSSVQPHLQHQEHEGSQVNQHPQHSLGFHQQREQQHQAVVHAFRRVFSGATPGGGVPGVARNQQFDFLLVLDIEATCNEVSFGFT